MVAMLLVKGVLFMVLDCLEAIACFIEHMRSNKPDKHKKIVYTLADDAGIPDKKKFIRDGAKYCCRKCQRKYYLRSEVVECFNYDCPEILESKAW